MDLKPEDGTHMCEAGGRWQDRSERNGFEVANSTGAQVMTEEVPSES